MDFVKEWGHIAGVAGLALGVFLLLFREVIRKKIFPLLTKKQAFNVIVIFMILVWSVAIFSLWLYSQNGLSIKEEENKSKDRFYAFLIGYESALALAKSQNGNSFLVEKGKIQSWFQKLEIENISFPEIPYANQGGDMLQYLQTSQGYFLARNKALESSFLLGFYGVVCDNTPQVCPSSFEFESLLEASKLADSNYVGDKDSVLNFLVDMSSFAYAQIQQ